MTEYNPPTENLPIFSVTVYRELAPYDEFYLKRQGLATSVATETSFSGLVSFNSLTTPPHCQAVCVNPNDLANKAYVDSIGPKTSYIVYLNYSQTFTTSTPTIYKKLNPLTNNTPTQVPFQTLNTTPLLIAGFFNTKADLKFANSIPAGLWTLVLFANCTANNDQNRLGLNFVLIGVTALGVETIIETSAYSPLINVLAPLIGTYSCILSVVNAIDITAYDQIGIKVYALSTTSASRDGSIFFQYPSYYSELQTSYATTQAADLTTTNNTWTGTNTFNNTTNLNTTIIQGSGSIQFPDTSTQTTAFKSMVSGIYTNSNITVDAQGAISAISSGVGGTNAETIDLTLTATGTGFYIPFSSTSGAASTLLAGGLTYNRTSNFIGTGVTSASFIRAGTAGQIPYQSAPTTTAFVAVGSANQVLISNGTSAPSWSTDLVGNAGSATTVALTSDDSAGDWLIPFSKTASATSNVLYVDDTTTPLTYNANLGRMSAAAYTVGDKDQTAGTNSALIRQTSVALDYINNATLGTHKFTVNNATPAAVVPMTIGSTTIATTVPSVITTTVSNISFSLSVVDSVTSNSIRCLVNSGSGSYNPFVQPGNNVIYAYGALVNTGILTLTSRSQTSSGVKISPNAILLGSGGNTLGIPTTNISIDGLAGTLVHTSTTCPTQIGYTAPAGSDSTSNIATTAWVQTAIPLGTSALATNVSGGVIGNVLYQSAANATTRMTNGTVGTVLTSGGVGAIPTWSANLAGNAGSATTVALVSASTGSDWIPLSNFETGNVGLRTNNILKYTHSTNTIQGNVSGSCNTSALTTNVTGGVIGNVLYQSAANATTRMTNGTVGTVLTSGGVSAIPTWSANLAGNAGSATYATNTTITNDVASATYHALTFVSNISGNLPQKTRANVSTGAGLTYVPSTNLLNVNNGGVGTVFTGKLITQDSLSSQAEFSNVGGNLTIINREASAPIYLQTADAGAVVASRVAILDTETEIINKLKTSSGIIGPINPLTYSSDMIGYTTGKVVGNGTAAGITTNVWGTQTTIGFQFPQVGVWMVTISSYHDKSAAGGNLIFQNIGLGLSATVAPTGQGTFLGTSNSTATQPAVGGYLVGALTNVSVITSIASIYYLVFQVNFTGSVYTKSPVASYYTLTRLA